MTTEPVVDRPRTVIAPLVWALVFCGAYLLVSPVGGVLADRSMPLPGDPASEVAAYYAANPAATIAVAALQALSVVGLLLYARLVVPTSAVRHLASVAVVAMLASSILSTVMALTASDMAETTVGLVRQVGFYAGGVVHVVTLGAFVLVAALALRRAGALGGGLRVFAWVAGGLAVLSVLSVPIYYASALLPLGRLLCMVWMISAGIAWWRHHR